MALYSLTPDSLCDFFQMQVFATQQRCKVCSAVCGVKFSYPSSTNSHSIPLFTNEITLGLTVADDVMTRGKMLSICAQMIDIIMREFQQMPLPVNPDFKRQKLKEKGAEHGTKSGEKITFTK